MSGRPPSAPGVVVAHRAGNDPRALARAVSGADVVEADVHLFRGRLEVRHAKTLGPLPVLWERWHLLPRGTPRPPLSDVLAAMTAGPGLMLDLKGPDPRLPGAVLRETAGWRESRPLIVSSRVWPTVERLRGAPGVRTLCSVRGSVALRALLRRYGPGGLEGVAVHRDLLTPGVAAALRARAPQVWAWPVDDPRDALRLAGWGVTGFISDRPRALRPPGGAPAGAAP